MNAGPCIVCGATDYAPSLGGPSICPSCDCGIPPEVAKLRRQLAAAQSELWGILARLRDDTLAAKYMSVTEYRAMVLGVQG